MRNTDIRLLTATMLTALVLTGCAASSASDQTEMIPDASAASAEASSEETEVQGYVGIDFATTDVYGNEVGPEIFTENKVTVVNVWGTYCGPCIGEMPDLQNWYTVEQSKDSGVMIVGIPYDVDASTVDEAIDILRDQGVTYPNLLVDDGLYEMFIKDITVVPTTYIVDSNGNIVAGPIEGAYIDFYHDEVLAYLDE